MTFSSLQSGDLSVADILLELLNMPVRYVEGPTAVGTATYRDSTIPAFVFNASAQDVKSSSATNQRLPSEAFVGSQTLSLADFAATLAQLVLVSGPMQVVHGKLGFEQYFSTDARRSFSWPIHPEGFAPVALLDLARLQG